MRQAAAGAAPRSAGAGGCSRSGHLRRERTAGRRWRAPRPARVRLLSPGSSRRPGRLWAGGGRPLGVVRGRRRDGTTGAGPGHGAVVRPVGRGGGRRGRYRTGQSARHRLVNGRRELVGLGQLLVGEQLGEAARVALADGAHLPRSLAPVELQGDDGGLGLQAGDGVAGDLVAVEVRDGDEGGGDGPEPGRALPAGGQGEQHADTVHGVRHGVQVHRETVVGGGLPGDLQARQGGRTGVDHPFDAVDRAVLVAERGPGHDRRTGRDPDLETSPGKRVVLSPRQLGRHRLSPCVIRLPPARRHAGEAGPARGTGRFVSGCCGPDCRGPAATGPAGSPASGPGRCGRWPACRWRSSTSPGPRGAPWP